MTQDVNEAKQTENENSAPPAQEEETKQVDSKVEENDPKKQEEATQGEVETPSEGVDYEAELEYALKQAEEEKERRLRAEKAIEKSKKKAKEDYEDESLDEDEDDIDNIVTKRVSKEMEKLRMDMATNHVEDAVSELSSDPYEQKLIKLNYENSIVKSGFSKQDILKDMRKARAIANEKRILKETEEARLSGDAREGYSNTSHGSNQSKYRDMTHLKLNPQEESLFVRMNNRRTSRGEKTLSKEEFINKVNKA